MTKTIINQDRDRVYTYTDKDVLFTVPAIHNKKLMGINLMLGTALLGTFNTLQEAIDEMTRIAGTNEDYALVAGYHSRGGW